MADEQAADLSQISPEDFAKLIAAATDDQIETTMRQVGIDTVLERIFEGMKERFRPDKAADVNAEVQFVVTDAGKEYPFVVTIANGTCEVRPGRTDKAKTTLGSDMVPFMRLITGQVGGPQLFMAGKLKVGGDLMFATRYTTFFDVPTSG